MAAAAPSRHRASSAVPRSLPVVTQRLGHDLVARAEAAKIAVAAGGAVSIPLDQVEPGLASRLDERELHDALAADLDRIVTAARTTVARAGLAAHDVDALYLTGGSTGLELLNAGLCRAFADARVVRGDRFASVATGLAIFAQRRFATRGVR
jgi:hypothetical chaperone protein